MTRKALLAGLLLVFAIGAVRCSRGPWVDESIDLGMNKPAPDFRLLDLDGREVSLSGLKGKVVLLDFWATWCGPCRMTMPILEQLSEQRKNEFTLLAINVGEEKGDVIEYVKRRNIHSTVLLDSDTRVGSVYQAGSIPMQILIDREGVIRHVQIGYHPRMAEQLGAEIDKLQAN